MLNLFSESGKGGTWRGEGIGPCSGCAVQLSSALNEAIIFFAALQGVTAEALFPRKYLDRFDGVLEDFMDQLGSFDRFFFTSGNLSRGRIEPNWLFFFMIVVVRRN